MATLVASPPCTTPPPFEISSPSSNNHSPAKSARSLPASRAGSFSSNSSARPSFACPPHNNNTTLYSPPSASSCAAVTSAGNSPRVSARHSLAATARADTSSPHLSQADLSILVATVSSQLANLQSLTTTPDHSPPLTRMRSLSHSQATARSNNTMFSSPSSSRPSSALYTTNTPATFDSNGENCNPDDMSDDTSMVPRSSTGGGAAGLPASTSSSLVAAFQGKENVNTALAPLSMSMASKPPTRSPSSSSVIHQPFRYTTQSYPAPGGSSTPLSTSPASPPSGTLASPSSSYAKHARRRSSAAHPRSPSNRSRPTSITSESQLPLHTHHHHSHAFHHARALQKAVEEALQSDEDDEDSDNADNEAPAKQQRRRKSSHASHKERRMSASSKDAATRPPTKVAPAVEGHPAASSPRDEATYTQTRGSRRGSASSARTRSRQNSASATFISSTSPSVNVGGTSLVTSPPRSRGSSLFKDALDMHTSSHGQSSSLSNRSDTTVHPADFSFSPPGISTKRLEEVGDQADEEPEESCLSASDPRSASLASPSISARASQMFFTIIKIRDYAFPVDDPRYRGEALPPTPIDLPSEEESERYGSWVSPNSLNGQMAHGPGLSQTQAGPSPSLSLMSSSSSSSLSSGFTPPPFGSFGYGHHYHHAGSGMPRYDASRQQRGSNGQLQLPPGGSWSTWDQTNLDTASNADVDTVNTTTNSSTPSASTNTTGRMWNFVTDPHNNTPGLPGNLLDSALSIEDFDDEFDDDEDEDMLYERRSNIGNGDEDDTAQQAPSAMTEEQRASEESFATLPAGTGIYRVQYAFAAEAPQEMDINEGDHVRVWQQLCDGWVIGSKVVEKRPDSSPTSTGRVEYAELCSGLVPQSYLIFSHTVTLSSSQTDGRAEADKVVAYYIPTPEGQI